VKPSPSAPVIQGALVSKPVATRNGIFFWLLRNLVRVRYTFFLVAFLAALGARSVVALLVWVAVAFVAVLVHELGHALAARFYRQDPRIELHAMGGVTTWTWVDELKWHERLVIYLAGPGIGFVLARLLYLAQLVAPLSGPSVLRLARYDFFWATIAWGVFNLLPVIPLDGVQALREILERRMGADAGRLLARKISCVVGFAGLLTAFALDQMWAGFLCGIFAFDNLQRMRGLPGVALPR